MLVHYYQCNAGRLMHSFPFQLAMLKNRLIGMHPIIIFVLILLAQNWGWTALAELMKQGHYQEALAELNKICTKSPRQYQENRNYLLHAWLLANNDRPAEAIGIYEKWKKNDLLFQDYLLSEQARLLLKMGKVKEARECLNEIIRHFRHSPYWDSAGFDMATSFEQEQAWELAANAFTIYIQRQGKLSQEAALHLVRIRLIQKHSLEAAHGLEKLLSRVKKTRLAVEAAILLAEHSDLIGLMVQPEKTAGIAAGILLANRELDKTFPLIRLLNERFPGKDTPRYQFWMGRCYFLAGKYDEAIDWFDKAASQDDDKLAIQSSLSKARVLVLLKRYEEAAKVYEKQLTQIESADDKTVLYLLLFNVNRNLGKDRVARKWLEDGAQALSCRQSLMVRYRLALFLLLKEDYRRAEEVLIDVKTRLPRRSFAGMPDEAEVAFFLGLARRAQGRIDDAVECWTSVIYQRSNFYSHLCLGSARGLMDHDSALRKRQSELLTNHYRNLLNQRSDSAAMKTLGQVFFINGSVQQWQEGLASFPAYKTLIEDLSTISPLWPEQDFQRRGKRHVRIDLTALQRAAIFNRLWLYDQAAWEYARCDSRILSKAVGISLEKASRHRSMTLMELYRQAGQTHLALKEAERLLEAYPEGTPFLFINLAILKCSYPNAYSDNVVAQAQKAGIPPTVIWAIIRQESLFNPQAISSASARGLMQIMPQTGRQLAAGEGLTISSDQEWLFDPAINIRLGVRFFKQVFDQFKSIPAAVAAYNAGVTQTAYWESLMSKQTDYLLIPEITFSQTRDYVGGVLSGERMYQIIYNGTLTATRIDLSSAPAFQLTPKPIETDQAVGARTGKRKEKQ